MMSELMAQADAIRNRIPLGRMRRNRRSRRIAACSVPREGSSVSA
jgi:hypothetical protein